MSIEWHPHDEDEPDRGASANATPAISLHVSRVAWPFDNDRWEWTAEYPDDDGDDPHVLLKGTGLKSLDDAKRVAELVLRRWIAEQAAALSDGWISVEERLPEEFSDVLVVIEDDGEHFRRMGFWHDGWHTDMVTGAITHWRPLPPLPEVKK